MISNASRTQTPTRERRLEVDPAVVVGEGGVEDTAKVYRRLAVPTEKCKAEDDLRQYIACKVIKKGEIKLWRF